MGGGDDDDDEETNEWVQESKNDTDTPVLDEAVVALTQTYEQLCRDHIDAYIQSADKYLSETHLTRRVKEWQDKLEPKLKTEELHPPFDIHEYGHSLLIRLTENKEESDKPKDFIDVISGQPKYQVCRYFLAALQLANSHSVEISPSVLSESHIRKASVEYPNEDNTFINMNTSLKLKFLKFGNAHDTIDNYQAPSLLARQQKLQEQEEERKQVQSKKQPAKKAAKPGKRQKQGEIDENENGEEEKEEKEENKVALEDITAAVVIATVNKKVGGSNKHTVTAAPAPAKAPGSASPSSKAPTKKVKATNDSDKPAPSSRPSRRSNRQSIG